MYYWSDEPTKNTDFFLVICSPAVFFFFCLENWKTASKRAVRSIGCKGHALNG